MSITGLSVRKPAAVFMFAVFFIGLGVMGYINLEADLFPSIDTPVITIVSPYNGGGVAEI